jgi:hypothetical protein
MSPTRPIPSPARQRRSVLAGDAAQAMYKSVVDALLQAESARAAELAPLRLPPAPVATAPLQLAAAQTTDPRTRRQLVASYERCLRIYREIARSQAPDTTDDDLGAAMALFVAANLLALHGVDADRALMPRLERQLRGVSRRASNWDACSPAQRQTFFERIAILAVLVSGSHARAAAQGPAERAKVRAAARLYLQDMLGLNPELLTLGPEGLAVRSSCSVPAACNAAQAA